MPDFYPIARKFLFALDAERAHHVTLDLMNLANRLGILSLLTGANRSTDSADSSIEVMGLKFPNRVGLAAGLDKTGSCVDAFGAVGFGHVEVGTVTPRAQPGNPKPRLFRLKEHEAIINRMGFNNPGVDGMLSNLEKSHRKFQGILGINIGKNFDTPNEDFLSDYLKCFEGVYGKADYITANLSSPNTKGLRDLQSEDTCRDLIISLQAKREEIKDSHGGKLVPIVIKIAPDLEEGAIAGLGKVFSETGIDGVITTNTTIDRDLVKDHPLAKEAGGLSGSPAFQKSTQALATLRSNMDEAIPIIASGGVMSREAAEAKLSAGAALVQVYTGLVYRGPGLISEIASLG